MSTTRQFRMQYFLICIFLSGIFLKAHSNNTDNCTLADSLFAKADYFQAAVEYERVFFYSKNSTEKNNSLYLKSLCYKNLGDYSRAFNTLQRISYMGVSGEKRNIYQYETALMAYLSGEYSQCGRALVVLSRSKPDSALSSNIKLLGALNSIMLNDFDESFKYAKEYLIANNDTSELRITALNELYSPKNIPKLKSEKKLNWISIVPGFGQIYVGKIGEGITNLFLNAAVFSFGVYQFLNGFYFTGYFVGTLSINKLYFGGRGRASNLLIATNKNKLIEYHYNLKKLLTDN